jgi:hypothetical protein
VISWFHQAFAFSNATCAALQHGVNRVFVATDSTTALADTEQYEPEFEFIYLDMVGLYKLTNPVESS